jgi:hypothetical protein
MRKEINKHALALGLAGAVALGGASAMAAPVLSNTAAVKAAAPSDVTDVRWRGGGRTAAAAGVGFAAGALVGAAAASSYRSGPYAYDAGYDAYAYDAPVYDAYAYDAPAVGYSYGRAYHRGGGSPLGYDTGGAPIYGSQLGPGCTLGMKTQNRC